MRINMVNQDNFVASTLKVVASQELNIEQDLVSENTSNKTISELLVENNEKKEERHIHKKED